MALLDPARNEPRDLYDLWHLTTNGLANPADLIEAVNLKMNFRGKEMSDSKENLIRKEAMLKKLWQTRLSSQMSDPHPLIKQSSEILNALQSDDVGLWYPKEKTQNGHNGQIGWCQEELTN